LDRTGFLKGRLRMAASPPRKKRKPVAKSARDGGPKEAAGFIAEQVTALAQLARSHKLEMLAFLLDMSLMEAKELTRPRGKRTPKR
jgi:hypothetical protein